ncbi:hypothetical protein Cadr_000017775 [Camelus dromedarius]|uniref:Uncharacterized protein n=1 Tax=Camelus dromedarius TaxID=9838 RepID=A0A5N4D783_CAMDR|nr:hypothetical protein Cadr_000017775 [Camelus dromedarius]
MELEIPEESRHASVEMTRIADGLERGCGSELEFPEDYDPMGNKKEPSVARVRASLLDTGPPIYEPGCG